jgi:hypothetical protein
VPTGARRHTLLVSDKELVVIERALRAYAQFMQLQRIADPRTESIHTAHVVGIVQEHFRCTCAQPQGST